MGAHAVRAGEEGRRPSRAAACSPAAVVSGHLAWLLALGLIVLGIVGGYFAYEA